MPIDYSRWKDIEVSDDEDDTHPNVDTASLFRWRHSARVERMQEKDEKKTKVATEAEQIQSRVKALELDLQHADDPAERQRLADEKQAADAKAEELAEKQAELDKEERLEKWNVDTLSKDKWSKTILNKSPPMPKENLSDAEKADRYNKFAKDNEKDIKKYGMFRKYDDSKEFLRDRLHLVCEDTANYLVLHCLNLEMQEKHALMEHVAHQSVALQFILELGKQLDIDPRACVASFFSRIQNIDKQYKQAFEDELNAFKTRIRKRAAEKLEEAQREYEEEERQKRLGPGGLDPEEVMGTLPQALQECFLTQDTENLNSVLAGMKEPWAVYHMNRCVKSGLWVPADAQVFEKYPADLPPPDIAEYDDDEKTASSTGGGDEATATMAEAGDASK